MYDYGYNVPNGKITMERFYSDALPSKLPSTYLISHSWAYFFYFIHSIDLYIRRPKYCKYVV